MRFMEKKEILHLANLARIRISEEEAASLTKDIESVLSYVSAVDDITADVSLTKKVGVRHNIFREDKVKNEPNSYTEALLKEAPKTKGRHLMVKKILQID